MFSDAFPSYSIKARVLPMVFVDPHDLHWGRRLSDLHSSLGSLEHAPSQSDPLQGLALLRLGACLCPESCRICFSSPPAGSLLTCRCLSEAFPYHLSYFTIFPPTLPIPVDSLRVFLFFPQDFSHLDRLSVVPIYFLSSPGHNAMRVDILMSHCCLQHLHLCLSHHRPFITSTC